MARLKEYTMDQINDKEIQLVNIRFYQDGWKANDVVIERNTAKQLFLAGGSYDRRIDKIQIGCEGTYGTNAYCLKGDEEEVAKAYFKKRLNRLEQEMKNLMNEIDGVKYALEQF